MQHTQQQHVRGRRHDAAAATQLDQPGGNQLDQLLNNSEEPLDEHEQQQVIAGLEQSAVQQARTFRRLFAALAMLLAAFFSYAAQQQHTHPWETRYTGELRPVTSAGAVAAVLLLQAVALLVAGIALLLELPQPWERSRSCVAPAQRSFMLLSASMLASGIGCCYWAVAMQRSIAKYGYALGAKWELLWLPLGPVGYCALCWHVLASLRTTSKELQQLHKLTYEFKQV